MMNRFHYKLQSLHDLRQNEKNRAKESYFLQKAMRIKEEQTWQKFVEQYQTQVGYRKNMQNALQNSNHKLLCMEELSWQTIYIDKLRHREKEMCKQIIQQQAHYNAAQLAENSAFDNFNERQIKYKTFEKHKEKSWQQSQKIQQQKEESNLDELNQSLFILKEND